MDVTLSFIQTVQLTSTLTTPNHTLTLLLIKITTINVALTPMSVQSVGSPQQMNLFWGLDITRVAGFKAVERGRDVAETASLLVMRRKIKCLLLLLMEKDQLTS